MTLTSTSSPICRVQSILTAYSPCLLTLPACLPTSACMPTAYQQTSHPLIQYLISHMTSHDISSAHHQASPFVPPSGDKPVLGCRVLRVPYLHAYMPTWEDALYYQALPKRCGLRGLVFSHCSYMYMYMYASMHCRLQSEPS
jgi:hypothetical protein